MYRRLIIGTLLTLVFGASAATSSALGHKSTTWYWGPVAAERSYQTEYAVLSVDCVGYGKYIRSEHGRRLYRHFECYAVNLDGTKEYDDLHVTGRRGFVVYD